MRRCSLLESLQNFYQKNIILSRDLEGCHEIQAEQHFRKHLLHEDQ